VRRNDQAELRDQCPKDKTTAPPQPQRIVNAMRLKSSYKDLRGWVEAIQIFQSLP
jgi:hypothetical protein